MGDLKKSITTAEVGLHENWQERDMFLSLDKYGTKDFLIVPKSICKKVLETAKKALQEEIDKKEEIFNNL